MPRASATAASPRRAAGEHLSAHRFEIKRHPVNQQMFYSAGDSKDVTGLVKALHQAAKDRSISPKEVCAAMIQIEKQKLPVSAWIFVLQNCCCVYI